MFRARWLRALSVALLAWSAGLAQVAGAPPALGANTLGAAEGACADQAVVGTGNLIANPGAEAGPGAAGDGVVALPC